MRMIFGFCAVILAASASAASLRIAPAAPLTATSLSIPLAASAPSQLSTTLAFAEVYTLPSARTMLGLREDADRLYASLASLHARVMKGDNPAALRVAKRALLREFDGALDRLPEPPILEAPSLREKVQLLQKQRVNALRDLARAEPDRRADAKLHVAELSGALAVMQIRVARHFLDEDSPLKHKSMRRNAALWSLVGAHNSAATAAMEAVQAEAIENAERSFGSSPLLERWNRWSQIHSRLDSAALHARNDRPEQATQALLEAAALLGDAGRDPADVRAAARLRELAAAPDSDSILAAKSLVAHPDIKSPTTVSYESVSETRRALLHALLSGHDQFLETLRHDSAARLASALLTAPRPSAQDLVEARAGLASALEWCGSPRIRVQAKRQAAVNLRAALAAMDQGDWRLAARHAEWAANLFAERRAELSRQGTFLRLRLLRRL